MLINWMRPWKELSWKLASASHLSATLADNSQYFPPSGALICILTPLSASAAVFSSKHKYRRNIMPHALRLQAKSSEAAEHTRKSSESEPSSDSVKLVRRPESTGTGSDKSSRGLPKEIRTRFTKWRNAVKAFGKSPKAPEKTAATLRAEHDAREGQFCDCLVELMHWSPAYRRYLSADSVAEYEKHEEERALKEATKKSKKRGSHNQSRST